MKFKKQFEEPVIFPVKLELGGCLCASPVDYTEGEGMDEDNDSWK